MINKVFCNQMNCLKIATIHLCIEHRKQIKTDERNKLADKLKKFRTAEYDKVENKTIWIIKIKEREFNKIIKELEK